MTRRKPWIVVLGPGFVGTVTVVGGVGPLSVTRLPLVTVVDPDVPAPLAVQVLVRLSIVSASEPLLVCVAALLMFLIVVLVVTDPAVPVDPVDCTLMSSELKMVAGPYCTRPVVVDPF